MVVSSTPSIPRPIPAELTRGALLERLECGDAQLVALSAPTGYGKTTLLAQYARNAPHACVWLNLSADDSDPSTLLRSLCAALEARDVLVAQARAALERGVVGEALARALAADLGVHGTALDLIVDGAERIGAVSGRWLVTLAEHLMPGQRVLLSGFEVAELRLARLIARGTAVVIGAEALRFSLSEATAYLRSRGFEGDALEAFEHCDGWPVGLGLIGAGAHLQLTQDDLVLDALEGLPEAVRAVLPDLAVVEVWVEAPANPAGLPTGWLGAVRRVGLPLTPLGDGAYKPHAILRAALMRELERDPARHARVHRAAALRAEARGATQAALEHHVQAGDQPSAFALARDLCERYLTVAAYDLIRQLLERFTPVGLPSDLRAALAAAWIETGQVAKGQALLRELERTGTLNALGHYVLGKAAARRGEYASELRHAEAGLALEPNDAGWRACERLRGWALLDLGRLEEAAHYATALVARCEAGGDVHDLGATLLLAHNAALALGQRDTSQSLLRRALEIYDALDAPVRVAMIRNELADLLRERGEWTAAQATLAPALHGAHTLPGEVAAHLFETQGDLHAHTGALEAARAAFDEAKSLCALHDLTVLGERIAAKRAALHPMRGAATAVPSSPRLGVHLKTFGERGVTLNGAPVTVGLSKSFELLVFLALHGPSPREAIMDALWEGSREGRHQEYFKVAVRRLRAALATPEVLNPVPLVGDRYALGKEFVVHVDAHALEEPDAHGAIETALHSFDGAFLEGIDSAWASERREHYAAALEDAYLHWGRSARQRDPERALTLFARGLRLHPLSESLLLASVETLCELGRHGAAGAAFARFKSALKNDLGVEPDRDLLRRLERAGLPPLGDSPRIPSGGEYSGA
jgi:DNA-binding SARP family transcriptional activator